MYSAPSIRSDTAGSTLRTRSLSHQSAIPPRSRCQTPRLQSASASSRVQAIRNMPVRINSMSMPVRRYNSEAKSGNMDRLFTHSSLKGPGSAISTWAPNIPAGGGRGMGAEQIPLQNGDPCSPLGQIICDGTADHTTSDNHHIPLMQTCSPPFFSSPAHSDGHDRRSSRALI